MTVKKECILDAQRVEKIIMRMAYQVLEGVVKEKEVIFVGIQTQGYKFAKALLEKFVFISSSKIKSSLYSLEINKTDIKTPVYVKGMNNIEVNKYFENKVVILVDDVLNSGTVMAHALSYLLNFDIKRISSTVLVNRNNPIFPIGVHYSGVSLSTTLDKYVQVIFKTKGIEAYMHSN